MNLKIIKYRSQEYESMCELRDDVLRKPIGLKLTEEETQKDSGDILFACMDHERVIGCCILTPLGSETGKLRQMAVSTQYQGQGIGRKVLHFAEQYAWEQGYKILVLHARKIAVGFYEKEGYKINGDEFIEVGIPHFKMNKINE